MFVQNNIFNGSWLDFMGALISLAATGFSFKDSLTNSLQEIWGKLLYLFSRVEVNDIFDILIVTFLVYEVIILVRHTRGQNLAIGIVVLLFAFGLATVARLTTLSYILRGVMQFGIVVLAVIFQPELRRALEQVGGVNTAFTRIFKPPHMEEQLQENWKKAIVAICDAVENMAESKTGALIVLERRVNLVEIIHTGTPLHCDINVETLGTIFYEGTPLHDGAVVVRDARVEAAGCFLPLSNNLEIGKDMGTRHRSALGMSENSDAVVVVVSEETGIISLAKAGVLIRRLDRQNLIELLISEMVPKNQEEKKKRLGKARKEQADEQEK